MKRSVLENVKVIQMLMGGVDQLPHGRKEIIIGLLAMYKSFKGEKWSVVYNF